MWMSVDGVVEIKNKMKIKQAQVLEISLAQWILNLRKICG